jgi:hypothetical protein
MKENSIAITEILCVSIHPPASFVPKENSHFLFPFLYCGDNDKATHTKKLIPTDRHFLFIYFSFFFFFHSFAVGSEICTYVMLEMNIIQNVLHT